MSLLRLLFQTVALALEQIWANKVRALLTTLGIIVAVSAISAVSAVGQGFRAFVLDQFATFGANKVWIFPDMPDDQPGRYSWRQIRLKPYELEGILDSSPSLARYSPIMEYTARVEVGDRVREFVKVTGIDPAWHEIEQRFVTVGRPFSSIDTDERRSVVLVNDKGVEELGLPRDPTGTVMLVGARRFTIIGVVETRTVSPMFGGNEAQTELFIPFSTGELMRPNPRMYVVAQSKGPELAEDVKAEVRAHMRRVRQLGPDEPNTFGVETIDSVISQFNKLAAGITVFLAGVVGISLLVGGIGIMNIMLVSVSERTHEIGLRKAVGARPTVILLQFLVEAVTLCLIGCIVGLALGGALVLIFQSIPDTPVSKASVPAWAVILSAGFSMATGLIFGMFPALKAARLDPIVALRHE